MTNAIIMASGMGTRMRPLTETTPKPLIKVGDRPMIETVLEGLKNAGIDKFIIVTGYLGDQFDYLKEKYPNVVIVRNTVYETVNNISSVYAAKDYLLEGDCFICEADLYVSDPTLFAEKLNGSCYFGKMVKGFSDDWVFDTDKDGIITRVGKKGTDCYNMTGIAFLKKEDAATLYNAIREEYEKPGYEDLFWDDVVDRHIKEFKLTVHPIKNESIIEIDTVEELEEVRGRIK